MYKLITIQADRNKLSNVLDDDVIRKTVYNWSQKSMRLILKYQVPVD